MAEENEQFLGNAIPIEIYHSGNTRYYHGFVDPAVSWNDAYEKCVSHNGWLATIEDDTVLALISEQLRGVVPGAELESVNAFWIGLHTGKWSWMDG